MADHRPSLDASLVVGTGSVMKLTEQQIQGLEFEAELLGEDFNSLAREFARETELARASSAIETGSPDNFVKAGIANPGSEFDYYIQTVIPLSGSELSQLTSLSGDTEARSGLPYDSQTQDIVASELLRLLDERGMTARQGSSAYLDDDGRGYFVEFNRADGVSDDAVDAAIAWVRDSVQRSHPELQNLAVSFQEVPEGTTLNLEDTVKGGSLFENYGGADCTAGYTARRNGNLGVTAARHCDNDLVYMGSPGVVTYAGNADPAAGGRVDLQYHRTNAPNSTVATFRWNGNASSWMTVTDVLNPVDNQTVNVHGISTPYGVTDVDIPQLCSAFTDGFTYCGLARTADYVTQGGDSGGPWSRVGIAYGTHSAGGPSHSFFTRIGTVSSHLNATVLQQ